MIGSIYFWGQGVAIDYARAMAAYKVGAEAGDAESQYQLGAMYHHGRGVDVDYAQALAWIQKAAAQDLPAAFDSLGVMYFKGQGVTPSFRRTREYCERAIELGDSHAVEKMQNLTASIQAVTIVRRRWCLGAPSHCYSMLIRGSHRTTPLDTRATPEQRP